MWLKYKITRLGRLRKECNSLIPAIFSIYTWYMEILTIILFWVVCVSEENFYCNYSSICMICNPQFFNLPLILITLTICSLNNWLILKLTHFYVHIWSLKYWKWLLLCKHIGWESDMNTSFFTGGLKELFRKSHIVPLVQKNDKISFFFLFDFAIFAIVTLKWRPS